jgi:hypothetical protein
LALIALPVDAWALSSMECRSALMKWKRTSKPHAAFVYGQHIGYEYCGWITSAASKEAAIKAAMAACVKVGARGCTVHSTR